MADESEYGYEPENPWEGTDATGKSSEQLRHEAKVFMLQWAKMMHAMVDRANEIAMTDDGMYHFVIQLGCISDCCSLIVQSAPSEIHELLYQAWLSTGQMVQTAIELRQDEVEVMQADNDGMTSYRIIVGGNLGRSLGLG